MNPLRKHLEAVITAAEIIDGQDSPPADEDVSYLHKVIGEARDAMAAEDRKGNES